MPSDCIYKFDDSFYNGHNVFHEFYIGHFPGFGDQTYLTLFKKMLFILTMRDTFLGGSDFELTLL